MTLFASRRPGFRGLPRPQFVPVAVQDGDHFVVVDVTEAAAEVAVPEEPEVREQLAEPQVRGEGQDFGDEAESFAGGYLLPHLES